MSLPSASRQPCNWLSCIDETRNLPSGLNITAMWLPAHFITGGFWPSILAHHSETPP